MPMTNPLGTVQARMSAIEERIAALSNGGRPPVAVTESGALQSRGSKKLSGSVPNPLFAGALATQLAKSAGAGALSLSPSSSAGSPKAQAFVAELKKHLGVPYVWGGTNPATGLDCSGLVQTAARAVGVNLPRVTWDQWKAGQKVDSLEQAAPGDLLITRGGEHVAVYLGEDKAIHAPRPGQVVTIVDVKDLGKIAGIRRVMPDAQSLGGVDPAVATQFARSAMMTAALGQAFGGLGVADASVLAGDAFGTTALGSAALGITGFNAGRI